MTCPTGDDWTLASMDLLAESRADELREHLEGCNACRERYNEARRGHVELLRTYEALDRNHDAGREQLMASLPAEPPRVVSTSAGQLRWRRLGGYLMSFKNNTAGRRAAVILAPAACIVIAVAAFMSVGQQSAFAAAIEHLRQAKIIICELNMPTGPEISGTQINVEGKMYVSAEYGSFVELHLGGMPLTRQYTPLEGPTLIISPATKSYFEIDISKLAPEGGAKTARTPAAWINKIKALETKAHIDLGHDIIDGIDVVGFEVDGAALGFGGASSQGVNPASMRIWVDEATERPVRIEINVPPDSGKPLTILLDKFEWHADVDPSIFEPVIPEGFIELDLQLPRPSEKTLLLALEEIKSLTGGRYTKTLQAVYAIAELTEMRGKDPAEPLADDDRQAMAQLALDLASGCQYYMQLVQKGCEPEYFGETVTADDADEVLLRWRLDDGSFRVIYGDLRVETVTASDVQR